MTGAPDGILRVGLTGGIASGKSTVAALFAAHGAGVLDGDGLAHAATDPGGAAHAEVVARFGSALLDAAGRVDRAALARIVFADAAARADLERIVHPHVREAAARATVELGRAGARIVVFHAALLVETGSWRELDRLVVARCRPAIQIERLLARGLDRAAALGRLAAQAPLAAKLCIADYVVDTDGALETTRRGVARVWRALERDWREGPGRSGAG